MVRATAAWVQSLWHRLFTATLAVKGSLAAIESLVGLGMWLSAHFAVTRGIDLEKPLSWLQQHKLAQDPSDPLVQLSQQTAQQVMPPTDDFYALYLVMHGLLKLIMVLLLARRVLWAYPAAMAVLACFVVYQFYEFVNAQSYYLLLLCGFDSFMIYLVAKEYRLLKTPGQTKH